MNGCCGPSLAICTPGPQGPQGPTGPTGGGGGGALSVSITGNVAGFPALISSGLIMLAGGPGMTLSQNGNTILFSAAAQTTQTQPAGAIAGTGASTGTAAGSLIGASLGTNGLSLAMPAWITGGGGINVSLGGNTSGTLAQISSGTLFLAGGNNVTLIQNGNSVSISANTAAAANLSVSAGSTSGAFGGLTFANSNGFSFGLNNGTITGNYNSTQFAGIGTTFAGTNASASMTLNSAGLNLEISAAAGGSGASTGGIYVAGNTTGQSSSSTYPQSSLNISLAGILSGGWSGNTLILSAPGTTQLALSAYAVSNTTQSTSGTIAGSALSFAGAGGVSVGISNGSVVISGGAGGGGNTLSLYALGNTTQNSSATLNQSALSFNAIGALTWGYSNGSIQVSAPAISSISGTGIVSVFVNGSTISIGANALTAYAVSNTTQGTSGTVNGTALSFAGAGGVSVGVSNGSVVISGGAAGGVSTGGFYALGNTTQNSSSTLNLSALSFNGLGEITVGYSNGSIQISAPPSSVGVSTGGNTLGNTGIYSGQVVFAGINNITLSVSSAAGGAQSISISGANQISTVGLYALGNTTQSSSTTLNQSALSFNALGAMTMGYSNGSIQVSAPATSSISGTGQVSISVNGSTISIGVPAQVTNTDFFAPYEDLQLAPTQVGQGSLIFDPQPFPNVQFDRIFFPIYNTNGLASSGSHSLSFYAGIYSRNASTLSLIGSTSLSTALTQLGTLGSYSLYSGIRGFSMGSTATLSSGNYWIAFASRSSSAGADGSYSNMALNGGFFTDALTGGTLSYGGYFGSAVNATNQLALGQGFYSATTTGMPASVAFSQINGTASNAGNMQGMLFASSTV
jgi:hypothetical protein